MEKETKTNEQQIEEKKDTVEPDWKELYYEAMKELGTVQKENEALKELQQQLARYDAYVKQQEITIRMLASMINK